MTQISIIVYSLLPPLWMAMTLDDKVKSVSIFQQNDCKWCVECSFEMKTTLGVDMGGMYSI